METGGSRNALAGDRIHVEEESSNALADDRIRVEGDVSKDLSQGKW